MKKKYCWINIIDGDWYHYTNFPKRIWLKNYLERIDKPFCNTHWKRKIVYPFSLMNNSMKFKFQDQGYAYIDLSGEKHCIPLTPKEQQLKAAYEIYQKL